MFQLDKTGRAPTDLANFPNKATITDFQWNPFDDREIAVGLDNGIVKIWNIPEKGLKDLDSNPSDILEGNQPLIYVLLLNCI